MMKSKADLQIVDPSGLGEVILGPEDQHCHLLLLTILVNVFF
jgi:hypothetical protein